MKAYNWDTNTLQFKDKKKNKFNIQLRGRITVVNGSSASGKTLLYNKIDEIQKDTNPIKNGIDTEDIVLINDYTINKLNNNEHKLIIIDRGDICLKPDDVAKINNDAKNRYLIFVRKPIGIRVTPNHIAELQYKNKEITAYYEFNVKGWC